MLTKLDEIRDIARAALMPDFFAVRIEEEHLFGELQQVIARIKSPTPLKSLERMKSLAAAATTAAGFVDGLKEANLWGKLRDILAHGEIK